MLLHDGSDSRDRWSALALPGPRPCPSCGRPRKDHTFPMLDRCDAIIAKRRGFKPWMTTVLDDLGEAVPT